MKIAKQTIEYAGVSNPGSPAEIRIEILGLRNAIKQAEELISRHEQALELAMVMGHFSMDGKHEEEPIGQPSEESVSIPPPLVR